MKIIDIFLQESRHQYTIYLDLDGVLTNFDKAVKDLGRGSAEGLVKRGGEGLLFGVIGKAGTRFWSEMEWTRDGKELWQYIKQHNYPVKILSAPTKNPSSKAGKQIWIDKNLGKDVERILVPAKEKQKYANQDGILIDDRDRNISEWRLNGGIAIHHKNTAETIKALKELIG